MWTNVSPCLKEHERAMQWLIKGAETGLPGAMHNYACYLDQGHGVAAPDQPTAVTWYTRAVGAYTRPCLAQPAHIELSLPLAVLSLTN
jgi:hypothetical protein